MVELKCLSWVGSLADARSSGEDGGKVLWGRNWVGYLGWGVDNGKGDGGLQEQFVGWGELGYCHLLILGDDAPYNPEEEVFMGGRRYVLPL